MTKGDVYISQKYSQEFKEPLVRLHDSCKLFSELVKEYGISNQTIYKWIKPCEKPAGQDSISLFLHQVQEMLKELSKMKEEIME
ncbi:transposase [Streptococcus sanguinis]|uniref:transposase n=1 Tax=Streptococcus sanguinis TaxID=1305 RepID=UPI000F6861FB